MKTLINSLKFSFVLFLSISVLTSCDGLIESAYSGQDGIEDYTPVNERSKSDELPLEIQINKCEKEVLVTLVVTSPKSETLDIFSKGKYEIDWYNGDKEHLGNSFMLECVGEGYYLVEVTNLKTGNSSSADIKIHNKF